MPSIARWNKPKVLEAIRAFAQTQGRAPDYSDFRLKTAEARHGLPSYNTVQTYCGSWQRAVYDAGLSPVMKPRYRPAPGQGQPWRKWTGGRQKHRVNT